MLPKNNTWEIARRIKVDKVGGSRYIKCPYCKTKIKRSIVPHLKTSHPDEWRKWQMDFIYLYNKGFPPQKIMKIYNTLFSWTVIEKEIKKFTEEKKIKLKPIKKDVRIWEPINFTLEKTTVWSFPNRGDWATHTNEYRGNWSPYVPRNIILQYSSKGDTILDPFVGGGTTLIECWLLGRNGIGVDISPHAINLTKQLLKKMKEEAKKTKFLLPNVKITVKKSDARNLRFIEDESIDLICTHPPYGNSLKYTIRESRDLSNIKNINEFYKELSKAGKEMFRVLKPNKYCALLIGDIRKNGKFIPLGFKTFEIFQKIGFQIEEIIIKQQYNDRSTMFYKNNKLKYRISHEYLFIFKKPGEKNGRL